MGKHHRYVCIPSIVRLLFRNFSNGRKDVLGSQLTANCLPETVNFFLSPGFFSS
ncbi:hypothetical protein BN8_03051 [Fibrisoma limi BUZ 3]|uniref:Uncharacterized protein n=1 Tax=Fibrisoma limi BUZ 3 TaxID=1185876 RepID=I2GJ42_9BACT|nr:hypothetical protein BN8_03051 [Fibrisoma limi BUZ 3]